MIQLPHVRQCMAAALLAIGAMGAQAATVLPVSCSTDPNIFNTGYNPILRGTLPDGTVDTAWDVSAPIDSGNAALPPNGPLPTAFQDAFTGNLAPDAWSPSPFSNAQWISSRNQADTVTGDWFYRLRFELDASISPSGFQLAIDFLADNSAATVWVNGIALESSPSEDPYSLEGYRFANRTQMRLGAPNVIWRPAGQTNEIIVQVKSNPDLEGFLAQVSSTALCPANTPQIMLTKAASQPSAAPGQAVNYTIAVDNGGTASASGTVVSDPLPNGLRNASWTCTASGTPGTACGAASGTSALNDTIANLPAGGRVTYTVNAMVAPGPVEDIVNTASASPPADSDAICAPSGAAPPCIATATVTRSEVIKPASIPTLSVWGIGLLALAVTVGIGRRLRAR
ncbi:DUF11 domain-containing protein [Comamonas koreensis]|uniref:DUF11 domain-containing protein n=1 Tax=Comamonas koreensis TaxID=160825 RepID=A0AAW4XVS9_9BURK|nr:DUF11 domain-containing protein [Comamonas koreensis]MCD2165527.1 DUF11 domain-containing protein [Comamonas koreensis]